MLNYSISELRWCYWSLPHICSHIWVMSVNSRCLFLLCQKLCYDLYFLLNWKRTCVVVARQLSLMVIDDERASGTHTHKRTCTSERYNCLADAATLVKDLHLYCLWVCFFFVLFFCATVSSRNVEANWSFPPTHNRHQWVQQGHQLQRLELIYSKRGGRAKAGGAGEEVGWVVWCLCAVIANENKLWYKTQFTTTTCNFFIPLWEAKCIHPSGCSAVFFFSI